jgi:hypothetical protein
MEKIESAQKISAPHHSLYIPVDTCSQIRNFFHWVLILRVPPSRDLSPLSVSLSLSSLSLSSLSLSVPLPLYSTTGATH